MCVGITFISVALNILNATSSVIYHMELISIFVWR